jgi:hypothetical protein
MACCVAKAFEPNATVEDIVDTALQYAKDGTKRAIQDVCQTALALRDRKEDKDEVVRRFHEVIGKYSPMGDDVNRSINKVGIPSNHYTPSRLFAIEELPLALGYIMLHNGDLLEAVKDGVTSGRDTDSIGVMIGSILGAMQGVQAIPAEEIAVIEEINRQDIMSHCSQFSEAAALIIDQDLRMNDIRQQQIRSIN